MLVEQAVFTSIRTGRNEGYQLAGKSPGITTQQARELSTWGPAHDSMLRHTAVNFHTLTNGSFCIAKSTLAGAEYSGRGGQRVYTQMLVVPAEIMQRFSNHPFRILEAATAAGRINVLEAVPTHLDSFRLVGRAAPSQPATLQRLCQEIGTQRLATILSAAISTVSLALVTESPIEKLLAGLFDLLPPPCRREFPFTTGLRFSQRRPFRIMLLTPESVDLRRSRRQTNTVEFDLDDEPPSRFMPEYGWPLLIWELLRDGKFDKISELMKLAIEKPDENFDELAEAFREQQQGAPRPVAVGRRR